MSDFKRGDVVHVEGVVTDTEPGQPFGIVQVAFPGTSDLDKSVDGVELIVPTPFVIKADVTATVDVWEPDVDGRDSYMDGDTDRNYFIGTYPED